MTNPTAHSTPFGRLRAMLAAAAAGLSLCAPIAAIAQPATTPHTDPLPAGRKVRPVRLPIIDLQALAKDRRPGQVMPGDPSPVNKPVEPPPPVQPPAAPALSAAPTPVAAAPIEQPTTPPPPAPAPAPRPVAAASGAQPISTSTEPPPHPMTQAAPVPASETAVPASPTRSKELKQGVASTVLAASNPRAPESEAAAASTAALDRLIVADLGSPATIGPAEVRVISVTGQDVQWRIGEGPWTSPADGQTATGAIQVRAGLDADLVLQLSTGARLHVARLGRITIQQETDSDGASAPGIIISRGAIEILGPDTASAPGPIIARVRTPDQSFGVRGNLRVEYDAFSGTRRRPLGS